jgi:hypothetical protein
MEFDLFLKPSAKCQVKGIWNLSLPFLRLIVMFRYLNYLSIENAPINCEISADTVLTICCLEFLNIKVFHKVSGL